MRLDRTFLVVLFAVLLVPFVLGTLLFVGCNKVLDDMCSNDVLQSLTSPDGKAKAVVFERGCGATTGFSTQISLLGSGDELPNKSGDVFDAYNESGGKRDPFAIAAWKNNQTLVVTYHKRTRPNVALFVLKHATVRTGWFSQREVNIEYRQKK